MCADSPGCRVERPGQSLVAANGLDEKTVQALTTLLTVVSSSYGPAGRLKVIHNNSGGHVTLTSCSTRMIPALAISHPILKLIVPVVEKHVSHHGDGGLFCALLSLKVITSSIKLSMHRHLISNILDMIVKECIEYLSGKDCPCVVYFDIASMKHLMCLTRSVISSKPGCCLTGPDLDHIQNLTLEAFLRTMDQVVSSKIQYMCVEGLAPSDSHLIGGILFETPQIPTYLSQPLVVKKIDRGPHKGKVKVALFSVSLAGDTGEFVDVEHEIEEDFNPDQAVLEQMKLCADALVKAGVGVVGCQRVVHPLIKKHLRSHGVLVLDRLGSRYIHAMQYITGCAVLGTFMQGPEGSSYGWLDTVKHVVMCSRSYLHLDHTARSLVTLILGHRSEETLEELKAVCISTQRVLQSLLTKPKAFLGGGCWQIHLAHYIRSQVQELSDKWSAALECSPLQVKTVGDSVASDLEYVAMLLGLTGENHMTDLTNHHHWRFPPPGGTTSLVTCCCGMFTGNQDTLNLVYLGRENGMAANPQYPTPECCQPNSLLLMDSHDAFVNGFRTALATACMVLGIGNIIQCMD